MNMNWTRPPPPQGAPPAYALVTKRNLRPVVMFCASMSALWALFSAIGNFRIIGFANDNGFKNIATFAIVMGALDMTIFAIETVGIVAAFTQRLPLVRAYALLSIVTTILVLAVGLVRVIVHFVFKNDVINQCASVAQENGISYYPFGFWGPISNDVSSDVDPVQWCRNRWNRDSWSNIVGLLIILVLAGLFTVVAWGWYRQVLDPSAQRVQVVQPSPGVQPGGMGHYNPPYAAGQASVPNLSYNYAPPAGPPPAFSHPKDEDEYGKPPGYVNDGGYTGYDAKDGKGNEDPFADFTRRRD